MRHGEMEHAGDVNVMPANQQKIVLVLIIFIRNIFLYKGFSDKPPHASCSVQRCDNRQVSKDQGRYVLEPEYTPGVCCPDYKKVACKDGETVYQVKELKNFSKASIN